MKVPPRPPFARPSTDDPYLKALAERVLIYDGATGTNLSCANSRPTISAGPT